MTDTFLEEDLAYFEYEDIEAMDYLSPYQQAVVFWSHGYQIPLDLTAELNEIGYDVQTLHKHYFIG